MNGLFVKYLLRISLVRDLSPKKRSLAVIQDMYIVLRKIQKLISIFNEYR